MFRWETEGRHRCTKCVAIVPLWFSMEHLWPALMPVWLLTDNMFMREMSEDWLAVNRFEATSLWSKHAWILTKYNVIPHHQTHTHIHALQKHSCMHTHIFCALALNNACYLRCELILPDLMEHYDVSSTIRQYPLYCWIVEMIKEWGWIE